MKISYQTVSVLQQQKGFAASLSSEWRPRGHQSLLGLRSGGKHKQEVAWENGQNLPSLRKKWFMDKPKPLLFEARGGDLVKLLEVHPQTLRGVPLLLYSSCS